MKDISQLFQQFLWECEYSKKLRPETLLGYRGAFKTFITLNPNVQLEDINTFTLTLFFKTLEERKRVVGKGIIKQGVKKSTIATYWSRMNSFFDWLERKKLIASNPFKEMQHPSPVYVDKKFLKKEQVERIFTAISTHYNGNLFVLKRNVLMFNILLFCGLRREELLLLQIRDFDVNRRIVTVRSETSKSGISRCLPLSFHVINALRDYLEQRRGYKSQYLFVSSTSDQQLSFGALKHIVAKWNIDSKTRFHLHQFRHTFAINFLKQSNNVYKLKQLMGHKDIRMTAVYLRCLPTDEMRGDIDMLSIDSLI